MKSNSALVIGRVEQISFPDYGVSGVSARIDTGARTSALWVSGLKNDGKKLTFCLFGPTSAHYNGKLITVTDYSKRIVASSNGMIEQRYAVRITVSIKGKRIKATFTLTNRSSQVYPVLIGRNVLAGKFLVDVKKGTPAKSEELKRTLQLKKEVVGQ